MLFRYIILITGYFILFSQCFYIPDQSIKTFSANPQKKDLEAFESGKNSLYIRSPVIPKVIRPDKNNGGLNQNDDNSSGGSTSKKKDDDKDRNSEENTEPSLFASDDALREASARKELISNPYKENIPPPANFDFLKFETYLWYGKSTRSAMRIVAEMPQTLRGTNPKQVQNLKYYDIVQEKSQSVLAGQYHPDIAAERLLSVAVPLVNMRKIDNPVTIATNREAGGNQVPAFVLYANRDRDAKVVTMDFNIGANMNMRTPELKARLLDPAELLYGFIRTTFPSGRKDLSPPYGSMSFDFFVFDKFIRTPDRTKSPYSYDNDIWRSYLINEIGKRDGRVTADGGLLIYKRSSGDTKEKEQFDALLGMQEIRVLEFMLVQRREDFDYRQVTEIYVQFSPKATAANNEIKFDVAVGLRIGKSQWSQLD